MKTIRVKYDLYPISINTEIESPLRRFSMNAGKKESIRIAK